MTNKHDMKVWPVKGDRETAVRHHYKLNHIDDEHGNIAKYYAIRRVHINSQSTQEWVERQLKQKRLLRLPKGDNYDLCCELLNEIETVKQSSRTWNRATTKLPNDQRDCYRYGFVGAQIAKDDATSTRTFKLPGR
jgi:hypothetical protein